MKKTINISLGGTPFIVDEDAYAALQRYIDDVSSRLGGDSAEVLVDVEARLAEIFAQQINPSTQVIDIEAVSNAIKIMGEADEFGEPTKKTTYTESSIPRAPEPQRLYRDTSNSIFGGVCSGLAQYLGLDTSLVRIVTFLLIFFGGLSLIVYIIMWIVIPRKPIIV